MKKSSRFDRCNPLLERRHVPCEFIAIAGKDHDGAIDARSNIARSKRPFTLRILEGHRTNKDHGRIERAIRLEISDEYRSQHLTVPPQSQSEQNDINPLFPVRNLCEHGLLTPVDNICSRSTNKEVLCSITSPVIEEVDPVKLYELEVGESDFAALQQDQALRVDFAKFSDSFIHLLNLCDLGVEEIDSQGINEQIAPGTILLDKENMGYNTDIPQNPLVGCQLSTTGGRIGQSNIKSIKSPTATFLGETLLDDRPMCGDSMYTCRIEELSNEKSHKNSWSSSAHSNASYMGNVVRFSIVESNQFRELTHLSLKLSRGTDASIKSYLSIRLRETIGSIAVLKQKLHTERTRASNAEQSCFEIEKKYSDLMNTTQQEKNVLVHEADETIQKQADKMHEEYKTLKETSRQEIAARDEASLKMKQTFEIKIKSLEQSNEEMQIESTKMNERIVKLNNCLYEQETISENLLLKRKQLDDELKREKNERKKMESQLHESQEQLNSLKDLNKEKGGLLNQMEESIKKSSHEAQEAHAHSERCALRLHMTEQELISMKEELSKTKDLLNRYQIDRQEMKRRMKSKVDLIQKQEEILASNEISSLETHQRIEKAVKELHDAKGEVEQLKQKLTEANITANENRKALDSNQKV